MVRAAYPRLGRSGTWLPPHGPGSLSPTRKIGNMAIGRIGEPVLSEEREHRDSEDRERPTRKIGNMVQPENVDLFLESMVNVALKDERSLMEFPFFSLQKQPRM